MLIQSTVLYIFTKQHNKTCLIQITVWGIPTKFRANENKTMPAFKQSCWLLLIELV